MPIQGVSTVVTMEALRFYAMKIFVWAVDTALSPAVEAVPRKTPEAAARAPVFHAITHPRRRAVYPVGVQQLRILEGRERARNHRGRLLRRRVRVLVAQSHDFSLSPPAFKQNGYTKFFHGSLFVH